MIEKSENVSEHLFDSASIVSSSMQNTPKLATRTQKFTSTHKATAKPYSRYSPLPSRVNAAAGTSNTTAKKHSYSVILQTPPKSKYSKRHTQVHASSPMALKSVEKVEIDESTMGRFSPAPPKDGVQRYWKDRGKPIQSNLGARDYRKYERTVKKEVKVYKERDTLKKVRGSVVVERSQYKPQKERRNISYMADFRAKDLIGRPSAGKSERKSKRSEKDKSISSSNDKSKKSSQTRSRKEKSDRTNLKYESEAWDKKQSSASSSKSKPKENVEKIELTTHFINIDLASNSNGGSPQEIQNLSSVEEHYGEEEEQDVEEDEYFEEEQEYIDGEEEIEEEQYYKEEEEQYQDCEEETEASVSAAYKSQIPDIQEVTEEEGTSVEREMAQNHYSKASSHYSSKKPSKNSTHRTRKKSKSTYRSTVQPSKKSSHESRKKSKSTYRSHHQPQSTFRSKKPSKQSSKQKNSIEPEFERRSVLKFPSNPGSQDCFNAYDPSSSMEPQSKREEFDKKSILKFPSNPSSEDCYNANEPSLSKSKSRQGESQQNQFERKSILKFPSNSESQDGYDIYNIDDVSQLTPHQPQPQKLEFEKKSVLKFPSNPDSEDGYNVFEGNSSKFETDSMSGMGSRNNLDNKPPRSFYQPKKKTFKRTSTYEERPGLGFMRSGGLATPKTNRMSVEQRNRMKEKSSEFEVPDSFDTDEFGESSAVEDGGNPCYEEIEIEERKIVKRYAPINEVPTLQLENGQRQAWPIDREGTKTPPLPPMESVKYTGRSKEEEEYHFPQKSSKKGKSAYRGSLSSLDHHLTKSTKEFRTHDKMQGSRNPHVPSSTLSMNTPKNMRKKSKPGRLDAERSWSKFATGSGHTGSSKRSTKMRYTKGPNNRTPSASEGQSENSLQDSKNAINTIESFGVRSPKKMSTTSSHEENKLKRKSNQGIGIGTSDPGKLIKKMTFGDIGQSLEPRIMSRESIL